MGDRERVRGVPAPRRPASTRADLDQAVPDRPAVLYHTSLHACVLNSAALRAAGFEDRQPDPPGGAFGRDGEGRLDGVVFEGPMFALLERNLRDDMTRMGAASGPASWSGPGSASRRSASPRPATRPAPRHVRRVRRGGPGARCTSGSTAWSCTTRWTGSSRTACRAGTRPLATEAVKIWADGGMSSRTAAIHGSYPVPPHGSGILFFSRERADRDGPRLRRPRIPGRRARPGRPGHRDRAGRLRRGACRRPGPATPPGAAAPGAAGRNPRRHRIEHAGAMYPALTARAAELGIVIVSQPGFLLPPWGTGSRRRSPARPTSSTRSGPGGGRA